MNIGITILATNAYFVLGLRFIRRFVHFYKGDSNITFYFFSDKNPKQYLPGVKVDIKYFHTTNKSWVDGTNLKFRSVLSIPTIESDYLFYFDADTNINTDFDDSWFIGDMVGGQHFDDQGRMKEFKAYDRNPRSKAFIPTDTELPQMYYLGAFFGGTTTNVIKFCRTMVSYQQEDKLVLNYEPAVNDESYINKEFHYNPPTKVVMFKDFKFSISDKGGLGNTRRMDMDTSGLEQLILSLQGGLFDIVNGKIVV